MKKILLTVMFLFFPLLVGHSQDQPLQLTIKSDKQVYELGEEIWIDFIFKSSSSAPIQLLIITSQFPFYHDFDFFDVNGNSIAHEGPEAGEDTRRIIKRKEILPGDEFISKVPLHKWKLAGLGKGYNHIGSEARKIILKGIYFTPYGIDVINADRLFLGQLTSNTITIEIIEKGKSDVEKSHIIDITRDIKTDRDRRMIQIAENVYPSRGEVMEAIKTAPFKLKEVPDEDKLWWYSEFDKVRIPYALTAEAIDYYTNLIESYRKQKWGSGMAPTSRFIYSASVELKEKYQNDDKIFSNVYVVEMALTMSAFFATEAGVGLAKKRVVVLTPGGKILAIFGDGKIGNMSLK